jgi:hypothetical protein
VVETSLSSTIKESHRGGGYTPLSADDFADGVCKRQRRGESITSLKLGTQFGELKRLDVEKSSASSSRFYFIRCGSSWLVDAKHRKLTAAADVQLVCVDAVCQQGRGGGTKSPLV